MVLGGPEDARYTNPEEFVEVVCLGQREEYALVRDHLGRRAKRNLTVMKCRPTLQNFKLAIGCGIIIQGGTRDDRRNGNEIAWPFLAMGVLSALKVTIEKADEVVVHFDKFKPYMGDALMAWVVGESLNATGGTRRRLKLRRN